MRATVLFAIVCLLAACAVSTAKPVENTATLEELVRDLEQILQLKDKRQGPKGSGGKKGPGDQDIPQEASEDTEVNVEDLGADIGLDEGSQPDDVAPAGPEDELPESPQGERPADGLDATPPSEDGSPENQGGPLTDAAAEDQPADRPPVNDAPNSDQHQSQGDKGHGGANQANGGEQSPSATGDEGYTLEDAVFDSLTSFTQDVENEADAALEDMAESGNDATVAGVRKLNNALERLGNMHADINAELMHAYENIMRKIHERLGVDSQSGNVGTSGHSGHAGPHASGGKHDGSNAVGLEHNEASPAAGGDEGGSHHAFEEESVAGMEEEGGNNNRPSGPRPEQNETSAEELDNPLLGEGGQGLPPLSSEDENDQGENKRRKIDQLKRELALLRLLRKLK